MYAAHGGSEKMDAPIEYSLLKYYNDHIVVGSFLIPKPGSPLYVYDRINNAYIKTDNASITTQVDSPNTGSQLFENNKYLIYVSDAGILYYKIGDNFFRTLKNSKLTSEVETYAQDFGIIDDYQVTLATSSNVLKVAIFKKDLEKEMNTKLREVEYVLP